MKGLFGKTVQILFRVPPAPQIFKTSFLQPMYEEKHPSFLLSSWSPPNFAHWGLASHLSCPPRDGREEEQYAVYRIEIRILKLSPTLNPGLSKQGDGSTALLGDATF